MAAGKNIYSEFDEYLLQGEPGRKERAENWGTAIGLQAVDGLVPSKYLVETAKRHVEGDLTIDEVRNLIDAYYSTGAGREEQSAGAEEADRVSANIAKILSEKTFSFSPAGYAALHGRIFEGVFPFAGKFRNCNITKREWILRGDTVLYAGFGEIRATLEYDFERERGFSYKNLPLPEVIRHLVGFISGIWQIHAFREGNTRATAVFTVKYLHSMGFQVENDLFKVHSWYFRSSLVRANYRNVQIGVEPDPIYLERFFRTLLMEEQHDLKSRYTLTNPPKGFPPDKLASNAPDNLPDKLPSNAPDNLPDKLPDKLPSNAPDNLPDKLPDNLPDKSPDDTLDRLIDLPEKSADTVEKVAALITALGEAPLSVRGMMVALGLKHRENFLNNYLYPALEAGCVARLYPAKPNHPRQKYLLTVRGEIFLAERRRGRRNL